MANGAELYSVKRGEGSRPLYAHPAFPALVAAWFAALLGVGSLLLPADLIGRALGAAGIIAAAAPLGVTARATIAIAGALAGTALGLSLARRVARSAGAEAEDGSSPQLAPRCRPIDVVEDLGEEGIAQTEFGDPWLEDVSAEPTPAAIGLPTAVESEARGQLSPEPSLEDLGLMQLTARLGTLLNERRARSAKQPTAPRPERTLPPGRDAFEVSDADETAQAIAAFFAPATANGPTEAERPAESRLPASPGDGYIAARGMRAALAGLGQDSDDA